MLSKPASERFLMHEEIFKRQNLRRASKHFPLRNNKLHLTPRRI